MLLELKRKKSGATYTIGDLYVDRKWFCNTLEDVVRTEKVKGQTAIPAGEYIVLIDFSQRFQRDMPHVMHVPNFEGIRIHPGNTDKDTDGCILVGLLDETHPDMVIKSRLTFDRLFPLLQSAMGKEVVCLSITNYDIC